MKITTKSLLASHYFKKSCLTHGRWSWPRSSWWRDFLGWRGPWLQICSVLIVIVSWNFWYICALLVPRLSSDVPSYDYRPWVRQDYKVDSRGSKNPTGESKCHEQRREGLPVSHVYDNLLFSMATAGGEQQTAVRGRQQLLSKRHWKFSKLLTVVLRFWCLISTPYLP